MQDTLQRLIYVMHIIVFEFARTINKKQRFIFVIINLNIRLDCLNLQILLLSFNFM